MLDNLTNIAGALSNQPGFYVLAFERGASDQGGKRLSLKVETSRKGADVRTRKQVTIK